MAKLPKSDVAAFKQHREQMDYELESYRRGLEVGSHESAERALLRAAAHAAILSALQR